MLLLARMSFSGNAGVRLKGPLPVFFGILKLDIHRLHKVDASSVCPAYGWWYVECIACIELRSSREPMSASSDSSKRPLPSLCPLGSPPHNPCIAVILPCIAARRRGCRTLPCVTEACHAKPRNAEGCRTNPHVAKGCHTCRFCPIPDDRGRAQATSIKLLGPMWGHTPMSLT